MFIFCIVFSLFNKTIVFYLLKFDVKKRVLPVNNVNINGYIYVGLDQEGGNNFYMHVIIIAKEY